MRMWAMTPPWPSEQMPPRRFQHWVMAVADLDGSVIRRIYVMPIDYAVTRANAISEEIGDRAFTVAREFSPLLAVVNSLIHHAASRQ